MSYIYSKFYSEFLLGCFICCLLLCLLLIYFCDVEAGPFIKNRKQIKVDVKRVFFFLPYNLDAFFGLFYNCDCFGWVEILQSTLVISTSVISNNRLSRRKNLVLVITQKSKIRL